ncbi:COMM domain-containing protein 6 isoform X3 [Ovis canadensis]
MAVSSDSCRSLKYPYVAVMLKVADHSGQVKNKSFEMTIPQFQGILVCPSILLLIVSEQLVAVLVLLQEENFYRQFKEIAAIIETV